MNTYIIHIQPKKSEFDPLAKQVKTLLIEAGETPQNASASTERLFKISGEFSTEQIESIAEKLLVDPVVENVFLTGSKMAAQGWALEIWPKPGVTDPVGDTVVKGLRDLGYKDPLHAVTAQRYIFPHVKESSFIKKLAEQSLANALIHDIHIEKLKPV